MWTQEGKIADTVCVIPFASDAFGYKTCPVIQIEMGGESESGGRRLLATRPKIRKIVRSSRHSVRELDGGDASYEEDVTIDEDELPSWFNFTGNYTDYEDNPYGPEYPDMGHGGYEGHDGKIDVYLWDTPIGTQAHTPCWSGPRPHSLLVALLTQAACRRTLREARSARTHAARWAV